MNYTIFTDGAYSQKNDEGAFAFVIVKDNVEIMRKAYKISKESNNRAELKAIIDAVHKLPQDAIEETRKQMIDKALEWIKTNIRPYYSEVKYHYDDFKKAMEDEQTK